MMNKKHRGYQEVFPFAINFKDFFMYSNPTRFAPRMKKQGGEAFPQAMTASQFFNYGAPTPGYPQVFQDGGTMNDIQQMTMQIRNHYGEMAKGGQNFNQGRPNKGAQFLEKIKQLSYDKVSQNLEEESYNDAMMQYGGNQGNSQFTVPDFTNATQWYDDATQDNNIMDRASNLAGYGLLTAAEKPSYYNKIVGNKQTPMQPTAAYGMELNDYQNGQEFKYGVRNIDVHKTRRWGNPANRLKSYTINYDIYDDKNHIINPQAVTTTPQAGTTPGVTSGTTNTNTQQQDARDPGVRGNFLANLFARKGNYREPQANVQDGNLPAQEQAREQQSAFDPRGYNSAFSDFRNQMFQNKRRRVGERLDDLYNRQHQLQSLYNQNISPREQDRINRLTEQYNRTGEYTMLPSFKPGYNSEYIGYDEGYRTIPAIAQPIGPVTDKIGLPVNSYKGFGTDYVAPQYRAYGGGLKRFQTAGQNNSPFIYETDPADDELTTATTQENPFGTPVVGGTNMTPQWSQESSAPEAPESIYNGMNSASGIEGKYAGVGQSKAKELRSLTKVGEGSVDVKNKRKAKEFGMDTAYAALNFFAAPKKEEGNARDRFSAANVYTQNNDLDKGDWTANEGYFRPDQDVPVQNTGYNFESMYAKMGGSYKKGGEYYLTDEEIDAIISMGGQVEFLD
jgi:hypothetical protein